jgi:hypothetical protein
MKPTLQCLFVLYTRARSAKFVFGTYCRPYPNNRGLRRFANVIAQQARFECAIRPETSQSSRVTGAWTHGDSDQRISHGQYPELRNLLLFCGFSAFAVPIMRRRPVPRSPRCYPARPNSQRKRSVGICSSFAGTSKSPGIEGSEIYKIWVGRAD